jgi:GT2 family glycosyltransferase
MTAKPLVTIAVPSFNQGHFLEYALQSIFQQNVPVEVFVVDAGSVDFSLYVINKWKDKLAGWRSYTDDGQAAAINEGIALGTAPYVCWINSDDWFLSGGLSRLIRGIEQYPDVPAVYGRAWNILHKNGKQYPTWVEPFDEHRLAKRCIISQPATLIRRSAWEAIGGLDATLHMALDYDLWWRLFRKFGALQFIDNFIAMNRIHNNTKTNTEPRLHYQEAMNIVNKYYGSVPIKWRLAQPYNILLKAIHSLIL